MSDKDARHSIRETISIVPHQRPHAADENILPNSMLPPRPYAGLPQLTYPFRDRELLVTACGRLCLHRKRINISTVLAGQKFGIKVVDDGIWLTNFMHYDLGYFDLEQKTLQPLDKPYEVVTDVLGTTRYLCLRVDNAEVAEREGESSNLPAVAASQLWRGTRFSSASSRLAAPKRQRRRLAERVSDELLVLDVRYKP